MRRAMIGALTVFAASAAQAGAYDETYWTAPKTLTTVDIGSRPIEILAVTRRARADTLMRRDFLEESRAMSKVLPGYPQQPFVSFDLRLSF